jgi:hypothetical protein
VPIGRRSQLAFNPATAKYRFSTSDTDWRLQTASTATGALFTTVYGKAAKITNCTMIFPYNDFVFSLWAS